jgi:hypothetical protein
MSEPLEQMAVSHAPGKFAERKSGDGKQDVVTQSQSERFAMTLELPGRERLFV